MCSCCCYRFGLYLLVVNLNASNDEILREMSSLFLIICIPYLESWREKGVCGGRRPSSARSFLVHVRDALASDVATVG
jgi:hypothetical protein